MEYYVINESGRRAIHALQIEKKDDEARVLSFLERAGSATVEQLCSALHMADDQTKNILQLFIAKRWVWKNITRASSF
jgi:hypothetical protein